MTASPAILGFTHNTPETVKLANHFKLLEEGLMRLLDLAASADLDPRWVAVARTHINEGFMALNRANFKPERITGTIDFNDVIDGAGQILKDRAPKPATVTIKAGAITVDASKIIVGGSIRASDMVGRVPPFAGGFVGQAQTVPLATVSPDGQAATQVTASGLEIWK